MPCQSPKLILGNTLSCGSCDYCVGRRIHGWVARAMMEKQTMGNALVFALTYSEETEHSRRSARSFDYRDIQEFMWNLRRQVSYHLGVTGAVSFIACGERGDRFDRCHWHMVVFSEVDLLGLGTWRAPWGEVRDASEIISPVGIKEPWRRTWSLWRHGFVTVQVPDYGGFRYAMSYALKDQFSVLKSEGTRREVKSEVFGEGYFVPSKRPPIGLRWIDAHLDRCAHAGIVPPDMALSVDGLERPFVPAGLLADRLLIGYRLVNDQVKAHTGRDAAGWSSLLHDRAGIEKHLKLLGVASGEEEKQSEALYRFRPEDAPNITTWLKAREGFQARARAYLTHRLVAQVGNILSPGEAQAFPGQDGAA